MYPPLEFWSVLLLLFEKSITKPIHWALLTSFSFQRATIIEQITENFCFTFINFCSRNNKKEILINCMAQATPYCPYFEISVQ